MERLEMEEIILEIYNNGEYPSISKVKKMISKPNVFREEIFIQRYKKILQ